MDTTVLTALAILVVVVLLVVAGWMALQRRRSEKLRQRFGPEYARAVEEAGNKRQAEAELEARQKRVESLQIRPLASDERERFEANWRTTQARFVDGPGQAIAEADRLVRDVMETRGYPVGEFEQRVADLSVEHGNVVTNYRAARGLALANEAEQATTEDLRQAMVHYRALFDDLLAASPEPVRKEKQNEAGS
jgi:hypothetical protein